MKLRCIVIDDEDLAREGVEDHIAQVDFLELKGSFDSALSASKFMHETPVDLMFLDINMPKLNGLDFVRSLSAPPITIITTAYPNYALDSYNLNVLDYLVKPIPFDRFFKAVNKAHHQFQLLQNAANNNSNSSNAPEYIFVKSNNGYEKLLINDILFVEGMQNYIVIQTAEKKLILHLTIKNIEQQLGETQFCRTHKSYIVNIQKVDAVEGNMIKVGTFQIPMSRRQRELIMNKFVFNKLLSKE